MIAAVDGLEGKFKHIAFKFESNGKSITTKKKTILKELN